MAILARFAGQISGGNDVGQLAMVKRQHTAAVGSPLG
jgi:hypothetical protein